MKKPRKLDFIIHFEKWLGECCEEPWSVTELVGRSSQRL